MIRCSVRRAGFRLSACSRSRYASGLSAILPRAFEVEQDLAQKKGLGKTDFDRRGIIDNTNLVVRASHAGPRATCQYRYPSLTGRSDVPKVRPPALFPDLRQSAPPRMAGTRRFPARVETSRELSRARHVIRRTRKFRGVTEQCAKQRFGSPRRSPVQASQHVVRPWANRPWSVVQPVSVQPQSPMATSERAPSSVQRPTSPIARPTPAPAGASTDFTLITACRGIAPAARKTTNPVAACAAAGFLHARQPWETPAVKEPGRD